MICIVFVKQFKSQCFACSAFSRVTSMGSWLEKYTRGTYAVCYPAVWHFRRKQQILKESNFSICERVCTDSRCSCYYIPVLCCWFAVLTECLLPGSSSLSGVVTSETTAGGGMSSVASQSPCTDSKKSIDEQLKEFGSRLSNKVRTSSCRVHGLSNCCHCPWCDRSFACVQDLEGLQRKGNGDVAVRGSGHRCFTECF